MYYLARRLCNGDTLFKREVFMVAFKRFSCNPKTKPSCQNLAKIALDRNTINGGNVMLSKRYLDAFILGGKAFL